MEPWRRRKGAIAGAIPARGADRSLADRRQPGRPRYHAAAWPRVEQQQDVARPYAVAVERANPRPSRCHRAPAVACQRVEHGIQRQQMAMQDRRFAGPLGVVTGAVPKDASVGEPTLPERAPGLREQRQRSKRRRLVAGNAQQKRGVARPRLCNARHPGKSMRWRRVIPEIDAVDPLEQAHHFVDGRSDPAEPAGVDLEPHQCAQHDDARARRQVERLHRGQVRGCLLEVTECDQSSRPVAAREERVAGSPATNAELARGGRILVRANVMRTWPAAHSMTALGRMRVVPRGCPGLTGWPRRAEGGVEFASHPVTSSREPRRRNPVLHTLQLVLPCVCMPARQRDEPPVVQLVLRIGLE